MDASGSLGTVVWMRLWLNTSHLKVAGMPWSTRQYIMLFPAARLHVALARWHAGANARLVHDMCAMLQQYLSNSQHAYDRQAITG